MFISHVSPFFHDICNDLYDCCHQQTAGISGASDFLPSRRAKKQLQTLKSTVAFTAPDGFLENY